MLCSDGLADVELEEILSCKSEPALKAYLAGLFRPACRLWKFVMPVEAKAVFQSDVFHPATVNPKLQAQLGLTHFTYFFISLWCADTFCTHRSQSMDFGTIS